MKTFKLLLITTGLVFSTLLFNSCLDDDGYSLGNYWVDVVTIVPISETTYYLRMDDGTTLWPAATNVPYYKPKENQRAMVNVTFLSDSLNGYDHFVKVNKIDEVLTKHIAENKGAENDSIYGKDPVEIEGIWTGDNYLNIYFKTWYGGGEKHFLNLIPSDDKDAMLEFRHNAYSDPQINKLGGFVAFNLSTLPMEDIGGQDSISLTIKVNTFDGDKIYKVKYALSSQGNNYAKYLNDVFLEGLNL